MLSLFPHPVQLLPLICAELTVNVDDTAQNPLIVSGDALQLSFLWHFVHTDVPLTSVSCAVRLSSDLLVTVVQVKDLPDEQIVLFLNLHISHLLLVFLLLVHTSLLHSHGPRRPGVDGGFHLRERREMYRYWSAHH